MSERPWRPNEPELEQALVELGKRLAYPPATRLAELVRARLTTADAPLAGPVRTQATARRRWRLVLPRSHARQMLVVLLAVLLLLVSVLVILPGARADVAHWLGVRGIHIVFLPAEPAATPLPVAAHLDLGRRVTLAEAQTQLSFRIAQPTLPGFTTPDEVYLGTPPPGGQLALVYRARAGLPRTGTTGLGALLTEFAADLSPEQTFYFKGVEQGTIVEPVTVHGERGYWLSGAAHRFFYGFTDGTINTETLRLAGNTLLWQRGRLTLRLESALGKAAALRLANSVQ